MMPFGGVVVDPTSLLRNVEEMNGDCLRLWSIS